MGNQLRKYRQPTAICLGLIVLAFLSTYPAFTGHFFAINNDGDIHLARLEALYQAFKVGHLPSLVNFIGFGHQGIAMTAMYPWLTLMIFVIPRFLFQSPMLGLAVGFFLLNLFTVLNSYFLMKRLSQNKLAIWFGVILYQFNAYHFQLMFTRVALGEAFGYAFLPLIFLGLFGIWQHDRRGLLWLGSGMGLVANSHVLSLVMFVILLVLVELVRLIQRKLTWVELRSILWSAVLALLMASYSLINMVTWLLNNHMVSPTPSLIALDPANAFTRILNNTIIESSQGAHMGLAVSLIMLLLVIALFTKPIGRWQVWTLAGLSIFVLAQNWLPWVIFANTPLQYFQFTMRLLTIVALFLTIGWVLLLDQQGWHRRAVTIFYSLFVILIGAGGLYQYHQQVRQNYQWALNHSQRPGFSTSPEAAKLHYLTGKNYLANVNVMTMADYHLKKQAGGPKITAQEKLDLHLASRLNRLTVAFDNTKAAQFKHAKATDQQVSFEFYQKHAQAVKLPVVGYQQVNYQVKVNQQVVTYQHVAGQLQVKLPAGKSQIVVSVAHSTRHAGWLWLSVIVGLLTTAAIWIDPKRLWSTLKRHSRVQAQ
ncbi:hypothetical protein RA086_06965 [Lactiplantibacillus sp. WILCCON 0030]|uniref:Uncharacterized protein n=1 Tax=Lactiplantibacillus brownii TaxID=3069269 RepID=A0ABU1A930_9LACO|nr:hypothetical protein [Lactiplantibacillus brownii]MDQ7937366.1 hypothetical protein [Lactiplantibacillus brownii]